jgi:hypothetical protein
VSKPSKISPTVPPYLKCYASVSLFIASLRTEAKGLIHKELSKVLLSAQLFIGCRNDEEI